MPTFGGRWKQADLASKVKMPPNVGTLLTDSLTTVQELRPVEVVATLGEVLTAPELASMGITTLERPVTLLITPRPAERPRFSKFGGAYNSKTYSAYKQCLVEQLEAKISEGKIRLPADYAGMVVDFYMEVPKSWSKRQKTEAYGTLHRKKPDADNYLKAIADALTEAKVFTDDGQVAQMLARKWYAMEGSEARIELRLFTLDEIYNQSL